MRRFFFPFLSLGHVLTLLGLLEGDLPARRLPLLGHVKARRLSDFLKLLDLFLNRGIKLPPQFFPALDVLPFPDPPVDPFFSTDGWVLLLFFTRLAIYWHRFFFFPRCCFSFPFLIPLLLQKGEQTFLIKDQQNTIFPFEPFASSSRRPIRPPSLVSGCPPPRDRSHFSLFLLFSCGNFASKSSLNSRAGLLLSPPPAERLRPFFLRVATVLLPWLSATPPEYRIEALCHPPLFLERMVSGSVRDPFVRCL